MNFVTKEPINKGWSSDKKYCVTDKNGTRYLLRVSDIAEYDKKKTEFEMMKQVSALGVPCFFTLPQSANLLFPMTEADLPYLNVTLSVIYLIFPVYEGVYDVLKI